jgi:hypothetical protein
LKRRLDTTKIEKETLQQDIDQVTQEKSQLITTLDQWSKKTKGLKQIRSPIPDGREP